MYKYYNNNPTDLVLSESVQESEWSDYWQKAKDFINPLFQWLSGSDVPQAVSIPAVNITPQAAATPQAASPRSESEIIKQEVLRGQRNESQLTDLVFYSRHPELRGRKLSSSMSNYKALAKEWVDIRNSLVQPLLTGAVNAATQPVNGPVTSSNVQSEWAANPWIKSKYTGWKLYEVKRNEVLRWGITNPAVYIEGAIQEWAANPGIHPHFNGGFDGDPHSSYLNLKRLYQAKGIINPAAYFSSKIVSIKFFNKTTPGHKDLKIALDNAQSNLFAGGYNYKLDSAWSFVPRTFNDNINKLSNHALGTAIDINPDTNPHITSQDIILIINAVCKPVIPQGLLAQTDPNIIKQASDYFKNVFNVDWIDLQTQPSIVSAIKRNRNTLDKYAMNGFMNLPIPLIRALQKAGLSWGGTWKSAKDFMHFELL